MRRPGCGFWSMRGLSLAAAALSCLASWPAAAQPAPGSSGQVPVDHGPNNPAANNAYQGGGVVLQGAPGAPAPTPQPTPPGQPPKNVLPPEPRPTLSRTPPRPSTCQVEFSTETNACGAFLSAFVEWSLIVVCVSIHVVTVHLPRLRR